MKMTNAQIKALAKKANISMDGFGYGVDLDGGNPNIEKFAILIIRECISIAEDTRYDGKVVASRIKFNFGVDNEEIIRQIDDLLDAEEEAEEFENWCKESDDGAAE